MPTALIAEDEPLLREQLKHRLRDAWPELEIVATAGTGADALAAFEAHPTDVAFLDIRMPVMSGLDVAREIAGRTHVVFVTAYDEYAIAAFDEGAVDYLLKPVSPERIDKVVARLKARLSDPPRDLAALIASLATRDGGRLKWIRASLGNAMRVIAVDDVLYFQSEDKYTKVVAADGDALIKKPIKELFDELDPDVFWQVHRGTIVNLDAVSGVLREDAERQFVLLKNRQEKLPISRQFTHLFKQM